MDDSLGWFLDRAGRTVLLSPSEEIHLGNAIQAWQELGDQPFASLTKEQKRVVRSGKRAQQRFVEGNIRLVINVAKRYSDRLNGQIEFQDLINEGVVGLTRAVEKFDPKRGYKFSTYAYWWIRQGITRALSHTASLIRLPMHGTSSIGKLKLWIPIFIEEHGRRPTTQEMADHCGVSKEILPYYLRHSQSVTSLDRTVTEGSYSERTLNIVDLVSDEEFDPYDEIEHDLSHERLDALLSELTLMERIIIDWRYGLTDEKPKTLKAIGEKLGVTKQDIEQIENRTKNKILLIMQREGLR